jgi:hypothetical protein
MPAGKSEGQMLVFFYFLFRAGFLPGFPTYDLIY